jgi:hypothetical protein
MTYEISALFRLLFQKVIASTKFLTPAYYFANSGRRHSFAPGEIDRTVVEVGALSSDSGLVSIFSECVLLVVGH